jgi:non-specific serine/threonine protein kinase
VAYSRGEYGRAAGLLAEALKLSRAIGGRDVLAEALERLAQLAVAREQSRLAARLGGATEALLEALGTPLDPVLRASHERATQAMRAALGEEAFEGAWFEGRALPLEEAIAVALEGHVAAR